MISADFVPQLNSYAYSFGPPSEHHAQSYPGSPAKTIWVDNGFGGYTEVSDAGGRSEDMENLLNLLVEIRSSLGSNFLIALSVGRQAVWPASVATLDPYVDVFCVHAYGTAHFFQRLGGCQCPLLSLSLCLSVCFSLFHLVYVRVCVCVCVCVCVYPFRSLSPSLHPIVTRSSAHPYDNHPGMTTPWRRTRRVVAHASLQPCSL